MFPREELRTARLVLRQLRAEDVDDVCAYAADDESARWIPTLASPYRRQDARRWIEDDVPAVWASGGAQFAVSERGSGRVVGGIGLHHVSWESRVAEIGYLIGRAARGQGYATEAVAAVATWAFGHGIARLELMTDPANTVSQRVALAAGFTREGVRRSAGRARDGSRTDHVAWARLPDDPPGRSPRQLPDLPPGGRTDGIVRLRPWGTGDLPALVALETDPDVVRWSLRGEPPTPEQVAARVRAAPAEWLAGMHARCVILDAATGEVAGSVAVWVESPATRLGNLGYALGPGHRGRGLATRAVTLLARWAFEEAGLERVHAGAAVANTGSRRVLERAGFRYEGVLRSYLPHAVGRQDVALYSLLPTDRVPDVDG
ncbi:MAG TPA: GNAT family N-acetyltransferase [Mycobacteriales bacterium]|nr:GNAT family N-acetyltransferase [Mycobacteriales bacterium]